MDQVEQRQRAIPVATVLINRETGVAFLTPPRTASRSLTLYLAPLGFESFGGRHAWDAVDKADHVYTVVRHHADALVSWWSYLDEGPDFNTWWHDRLLAGTSGASPMIQLDAGTMWESWTSRANFVLKFEDLPIWLARTYGRPAVPHIRDAVNKRQGRAWRDVVSYEVRQHIARTFAGEMRALDYEG